jgi:hypothetical protein
MRLALRERVSRVLVIITVALAICCCTSRTISVLNGQAVLRAPSASALYVDVAVASVRLPLEVSGGSIAYRDVDLALSRSLERALAPQLAQLTDKRQHLALQVELVEARAEYAHERLIVELGVRATLRDRQGNVYLAQSHAHHAASLTVAPEQGAPAVLECTDAIGSDLAGWLAGVDLH